MFSLYNETFEKSVGSMVISSELLQNSIFPLKMSDFFLPCQVTTVSICGLLSVPVDPFNTLRPTIPKTSGLIESNRTREQHKRI